MNYEAFLTEQTSKMMTLYAATIEKACRRLMDLGAPLEDITVIRGDWQEGKTECWVCWKELKIHVTFLVRLSNEAASDTGSTL